MSHLIPRTVVVCLLCFALFPSARSRAVALAQADDQSAIRTLVEQFFAAYQKKDLDGITAMWSTSVPEQRSGRHELERALNEAERIEIRKVDFKEIAVEGERAKAQVAVELRQVNLKDGKASDWSGRIYRALHLVRESGRWKIEQYLTGEQELAADLAAAPSEQERQALLRERKDSVTVQLVETLQSQGMALAVQGKFKEALARFGMSLQVAEGLNDKAGVARGLNEIAIINSKQGNYAPALEYLQRSLRVSEELGDKKTAARTLNIIGVVNYNLGNYAPALKFYAESLKLSEELGDKVRVLSALNNIGLVNYRQGEYTRALDYYQRSLKLSEELKDKTGTAYALGNVGLVYDQLGDYALAMEYLQRSMKLKEELGDRGTLSSSLNSIGILYGKQGNDPQALEYFQKSLKLSEELGDKVGTSSALNGIGRVSYRRGDYARASEFYQRSLKIDEEVGDKGGASIELINIGQLAYKQGDYAQALDYYQRSLKVGEEMGRKDIIVGARIRIAETYLRLNNYSLTLEFADRTSALVSDMPDYFSSARTLAGQAYVGLNQPDLARKAFAESVAATEKIRGHASGGELDRQRIFESRLLPYYLMVDLLVSQKNFPEALAFAERAKGRVLLDVLDSGRVNITRGMTPQEREQDVALNAEIASLNVQILRQQLQQQPDAKLLSELSARLESARLRFDSFRTGLFTAHPDLKIKRGETEALTSADASQLLNGGKTALLEYVVGGEKSYLFVITRETGATRAGAFGVKINVFPLSVKDTELSEMVGDFRQKVATRDLTIKNPAQRLYDLLIKPVEKELEGVKELAIVPDGALWNLPFQALYNREKGYLLERYAISYAPSLSVLREMIKKGSAQSSSKGRREAVVKQSDSKEQPSLDLSRPELLAVGNPSLSGELNERAASIYREERLGPIPEAEEEVNTLSQLYGRDRSRVLVRGQALEQTVKEEAGKFRILHFATHALLDDRNPMYSRILLSQSVGAGPEDGLLEAREILELDLRADLVVLAACQTAGGRVGAGEGIIGTSWALFVAGSSSTVATQWKVESARAADLMVEFHRNLLKRVGGSRAMTKAQALRQAELKQLHGPYNHPAYWAAFIIIGDSR